MAVVVRKMVLIDGAEMELKTYQPSGPLSKAERQQADRLDEALRTRIPALAGQVLKKNPKSKGLVRKWHVLGQSLRTLVDDSGLASSRDIADGLVWQAIWHYLPEALRPAHSADADAEDYLDKQHKRKDHLSLCYEIGAFDWSDVSWIRRWDDWNQLAFRPGVLRDRRIVQALGTRIAALPEYPDRERFRNIVKRLGDSFPTRQPRDSSLLPDDAILEAIADALEA